MILYPPGVSCSLLAVHAVLLSLVCCRSRGVSWLHLLLLDFPSFRVRRQSICLSVIYIQQVELRSLSLCTDFRDDTMYCQDMMIVNSLCPPYSVNKYYCNKLIDWWCVHLHFEHITYITSKQVVCARISYGCGWGGEGEHDTHHDEKLFLLYLKVIHFHPLDPLQYSRPPAHFYYCLVRKSAIIIVCA